MHLIYCTRDDLFGVLPPDGVAAEIGVATGGFSQIILRRARPRLLHLVDPWEFQDRSDYHNDANNVAQDVADKRYDDVKARFADQIGSGQVVLHRAYSAQAAMAIADGALDWVFIDAMHTREAVLEDLSLWSAKVKSDGFILGHDYANHSRAMEAGFGVVEAVKEFCERTGYHFAFLTAEPYPTYLIVKDIASEAWTRLKYAVLKSLPCVVELTDPFKLKYKQREYANGSGDKVVVFSFSPPAAAQQVDVPDHRLGEVAPLLRRPGTAVITRAGRHAPILKTLQDLRVLALEPSASSFAALYDEIGILCPNIALYNVAAGEIFGVGSANGDPAPLTVPLDQYGLEDLTFLALDADGSEAAVLRGAAQTLDRSSPVIRLGIPGSFSKAKIADAVSLLEARNYLGFIMVDDRMMAYAEFESGPGVTAILFIRKDDLWALQRVAELATGMFARLQQKLAGTAPAE